MIHIMYISCVFTTVVFDIYAINCALYMKPSEYLFTEDSSVLVCDTLLLYEWLLMFERSGVHSSLKVKLFSWTVL